MELPPITYKEGRPHEHIDPDEYLTFDYFEREETDDEEETR